MFKGLKGFKVVTSHILCIGWYSVVTFKMFHGHSWSHYRRCRWFKVGFAVRVLVLCLTYSTKRSSVPMILEIDKNVIISFVLHIGITA